MEAVEDAATPDADADVDVSKDTTTLAPTSHPRKVSVQTYATMSSTIATRLRKIR